MMSLSTTNLPSLTPSSVDVLRADVQDALAAQTALRIVGGGTWLDAGRAVRDAVPLSTRALRDVIEYVPGDLVITVGAGITFAELETITSPYGQWLALDPYVSPDGLSQATIGATVATATHGPLSLGFGRVRDLVLGVSLVSGTGVSIRGGGRVVKNVAGFDLVRLTTGAWGTLGIITEVSLRLHARPAVDETVAIVIDAPDEASAYDRVLSNVIEAVNQSPLLAATSSLASLLLLPPGARHAALLTQGQTTQGQPTQGLPSGTVVLLARIVGNRVRAGAIRDALSALGAPMAVAPTIWNTVRAMESGNTTFRLSSPVSRLTVTSRALADWCARVGAHDVTTVIDPMRGTIRVSCQVEGATLPPRAIAERMPLSMWTAHPVAADDDLSRQLRARFDPAGLLNPGIFGEARASRSDASA